MTSYVDHLAVATAMSLYRYNISAIVRAQKLLDYFEGACADPEELVRLVDDPHWATVMAAPTAQIYLMHATQMYLEEATKRVRINLGFRWEDPYWRSTPVRHTSEESGMGPSEGGE